MLTITNLLTRQERRARRKRRFVTAREARYAARLARVGYKLTGETGALKVPSKGRTWHKGGRANGEAPPPGLGWDRSGPAYVIAVGGRRLATPVVCHRWRRSTDPE